MAALHTATPQNSRHALLSESQLGPHSVPKPKGKVGYCHASEPSLTAVLPSMEAQLSTEPQFGHSDELPQSWTGSG